MGENSDGRPTAVASHEQSDDADKSSGNLNHRRRNRQKGWNSNRNKVATTTSQELKFEGRCEDLRGHIYDCVVGGQMADQYALTTKEVAEYVGSKYEYGGDIRGAIEKGELPTIAKPRDPPTKTTKTDQRIWEKQVDQYVKRSGILEENVRKAYSLIYGQCTEALRAKLEAHPDFKAASTAYNALDLLGAIKASMFSFQAQKNPSHGLHEAKQRFYSLYQSKKMTCQQYLEIFKNAVDVIEHNGGSVGNEEGLIRNEIKKSGADMAVAKKVVRERYLACAFLLGADRNRYGKLVEDIENAHTQGTNRYPTNLNDAYNLLVHWKQNPQNLLRVLGATADGVAFAQVTGSEREQNGVEKKGRGKDHITCFACGKKGHYSSECTTTEHTDAINMLMAGVDEIEESAFAFHQQGASQKGRGRLPEDWILLDNQSTINVFYNPRLLKNIRTADREMRIVCNAGTATTRLIGDLPGYPGEIWYHPGGIANILSLSDVKKHHVVTYNSSVDDSFIVHKGDGTQRRFQKSAQGLYYMSTKEPRSSEQVLVTTVADKKSKYTNRDYSRAVVARKLQNMIGHPSLRTLLGIIDNNLLKNCPVTRTDVMAAEDLFGPNLGSLKGKTVRRETPHVKTQFAHIPPVIMARYHNVTIAVDIMFINKFPFFVSISRNIKFGTVELLKNRKADTLMGCVKSINRLYAQRGFKIRHLLGDVEYEPLRGELTEIGIAFNPAAANEHVPEIERYVRTLKERTRCVYCTLPFLRIPAVMLVELVIAQVFWLNTFPPDDGVSKTLSPRALIAGTEIDYSHHCKLEFGAYVQTHEDHDNTMQARTTGAIALRPTGNSQGGYYFMSLSSGRRLNRSHWTELPMPQEVIDRVHILARRSNAPRDLTFAWRDGTEIQDDDGENSEDDDADYIPDDTSSAGNDSVDSQNDDTPEGEGEDDNFDNSHVADTANNNNEDELGETQHTDDENDTGDTVSQIDMTETPIALEAGEDERHPAPGDNLHDEIEDTIAGVELGGTDSSVGDESSVVSEMERKYGKRRHNIGLRPRKPIDYSHLHAALEHTVLTQYSVKKGLRIFGEKGAEAVVKEMKQLHERKVITPRPARMLTREEKQKALEYLMFLKRKRCGRIKARGCADGRKQRLYKTKEETSSPTVATESLLITCAIDAKEGRDVATCDIPGAFMQASMDNVLHMRLVGPLADLLAKVDPDLYSKYIEVENGKAVIYVRLDKALYGTLQAAKLFWEDLSGHLVTHGFVLNPYDECVANKQINGQQCTIVWHVDDLKVSHADEAVVTEILAILSKRYGKEAPLTFTRGKVHDYLGMTLDYTQAGKVAIRMDDYTQDIVGEARDDMAGVANTPAGDHLFTINDTPEMLSKADAEYFHHMTARLLFLAKRARPDIQTPVAFLSTRVKAPDRDDYKKLGRIIKYLRNTPNLCLTLEVDNLTVTKWWVDASFGVHRDMRSHTGGTMTLGKGSVISTSTRQKLNTRSSTEAEVVGVDDVMPLVLWTRYFLEAQGYNVGTSIVYQDNMSSMLLEKNGRQSSGKRTRHINIRYFFVRDRIRAKEVQVEYCPTADMVADVLTKPLQGAAFRKFRDQLLNHVGADENAPPRQRVGGHRSVLEEDMSTSRAVSHGSGSDVE